MKELTMGAERENIPAITAFVEQELDQLGCSLRAKTQIDIAIDELYSNIAKYAYDGDCGQVTVRIDAEQDPPAVTISFQDDGKPFNPLDRKDPDVTLPARDRSIGGLGINMVKKSMDDVRYEYRDGKNTLIIRKTL